MDVSVGQFGDIHEHASSVQQWPIQVYNQISGGRLLSRLVQFSGARVHAFRELINQRVVQQGEGPAGRVCFGIPLAMPGAVQVQGREADERSILALWGGEEFLLHVPRDMDMISLSFERTAFEQAVGAAPNGEALLRLLRQPVVHVPPAQLARARQRLLALFDDASALVGAGEPALPEPALEQALMLEIIGLVQSPECDKSQRGSSTTSGFIVERTHRLAASPAIESPSVMDICRQLRASRRTVQNAFRRSADTTPLHYIRSIRLNAVRRELLHSRAHELGVGDAAARWGFFHAGHFAADYRALFGEQPSQTPRAG